MSPLPFFRRHAREGGRLPVSHGHKVVESQSSQAEVALVHVLSIALHCGGACRHDDVKIGAWRVDFACEKPEHRLVVQYDGSHHHRPLKRAERDLRCARQLGRDGWRVLRVRSDALPRLPGRGVLVVRDKAGLREILDKIVEAIEPWIELDAVRVEEARRVALQGVHALASQVRAALPAA